MFTIEDIAILKQPGSWEKLKAVQETFFPKLLALQIEANKLIREIYETEVNTSYNITQSPTTPSRKGQRYNSGRRLDDAHAIVGLRAKGKSSSLTRPNGKVCAIHFALLAFMVCYIEEKPTLSVYFTPYLLKYAEQHREALTVAIGLHGIDEMMIDVVSSFDMSYLFSDKIFSLFELLQKHKAFFCIFNPNPQEYHKPQELAKSVIIYACCFPMLDLFTRLSNGEEVFLFKDEDVIPVNQPDYASLFRQWYEEHATNYINNFHVEPVTEQDIWQSEALTRSIFEEIIGERFPQIRPSWLKSRQNNASLELDGYCETLQLAFEYQGEYHYMDVPMHHQQRSLKDVQKVDTLKVKLCQKRGVDLVQVPYWEKGNKKWIDQALLQLNRQEITDRIKSSMRI